MSAKIFNYAGFLNEEGISGSRVDDIAEAMDKLHYALSKCDFANRRKFFSKDVITRLKEYGKATGMADVTDMGRKSTNCYVPVKKEGNFLIGLKIKDTPGTQLMCQEKAHDGTPIAMSFSFFQDAAAYCMEKNIEMGLRADDVTAIIKSSDAAKNLQAEALPPTKIDVFPEGKINAFLPAYTPKAGGTKAEEESLAERLQFVLDKVTLELVGEKVSRGMEKEEAFKVPIIAMAGELSRELHEINSASSVLKKSVSVPVKAAGNLHEVIQGYKGQIAGEPLVIQKKQDGEYRVPGPAGKEEAAAYYTDDRQDAIGTAKAMYGADAVLKFKTVEEHISKEDGKPAVDVPVKSGRSRR